MKANAEAKQKLEDMYGKRKLHEILSDFESHTWMMSNCKICPKCDTFIEVIIKFYLKILLVIDVFFHLFVRNLLVVTRCTAIIVNLISAGCV